MDLLKIIKNEFFPRNIKCIVCGEELSHNTLYSLCDDCLEKLPYNTGNKCARCDEPMNTMGKYCINCKNEKPSYKHNRSLFVYEKPINDMIRNLKYDNRKYLAETFANMLAGEVSKMNIDFDYVIPVPLFPARHKKRGYNQAELLCETMKTKLNMNVNTEILFKVRNTRSQANLSRSERIENLLDAFEVADKKLVKGKTILLIDDVFTTGTTINECAKTLIKAVAKEVYSLTLSHAHHKII